MLKGEPRWIAGLLALAYFGSLEILSWGTSKFPLCIVVSDHQAAEYQADQDTCALFSEGVVRFIFFLWSHADHNVVTALATVMIALFTYTLYKSTRGLRDATDKLWEATNRTAEISRRALTELEAPFLSIKIVDTGIFRRTGEVGHDFKIISFCITNHGRTPARLIEIVDKFDLLENGREWPRKVHPDSATRGTMPYGVIAPPNGESQPFSNNLLVFMMNALAADSLPLKTNNLFFYGFVRYSTIFDEVFRMGFCYMFDRYSEKWLLFGNEDYNYCCQEAG